MSKRRCIECEEIIPPDSLFYRVTRPGDQAIESCCARCVPSLRARVKAANALYVEFGRADEVAPLPQPVN
jgi:hypothetical protein